MPVDRLLATPDKVRGRIGVPLSVFAVTSVGITALLTAPDSDVLIPLFVMSDVMVGFLAANAPPRRAQMAAVVIATVQVALTSEGALLDLSVTAIIAVLAVAIAWLIGNSVRLRRSYAAAQREQAETEAVQAERLRIARELHDMIAHSFGVISVQAGMGRRIIGTQPEQAHKALVNIEEISRETAGTIRRMLGSLRHADPGSGPEFREPAPSLADLDVLVAQAANAGVQVTLHRDGDRTPLAPDIDLAAYRIIQESITNVIRHAHTDRCDVGVRRRSTELVIEVSDAGRGGSPKFGYGLSGMRERVALLSGEFQAGPRPEGGFRILARLPLPALSSPAMS